MRLKLPKSSRARIILTISLLQIAAILVAVFCVIGYMAHNGLAKGRWAFFIFVCILALLFAVSMPVIFLKKIPRTYPTWNWNIMLSIPAIILALLLLVSSIVISAHIDRRCMDFCALITVAAVFAYFLTLGFLIESLILFKKAVKDEKSRRESAIVNNMETQTDMETSTSQL